MYLYLCLCLYLYLCKHSSTRTRTGLPAHSNLRENRSNIVSVLSGELAWPAECCTLVDRAFAEHWMRLMRWLDPLSWLECFDAPSKLFLVEIIHKGNSVDFQDLKDTSLLTDKPTSWHQCRRKIVENQLGLPNLGPVPIHMALAINGGPSPSSVLTAASLFPFQTAHKFHIPALVFHPARE